MGHAAQGGQSRVRRGCLGAVSFGAGLPGGRHQSRVPAATEGVPPKGRRGHFGTLDTHIMTGLGVPWMREFVKTHQTIHLTSVHLQYVNYALIFNSFRNTSFLSLTHHQVKKTQEKCTVGKGLEFFPPQLLAVQPDDGADVTATPSRWRTCYPASPDPDGGAQEGTTHPSGPVHVSGRRGFLHRRPACGSGCRDSPGSSHRRCE